MNEDLRFLSIEQAREAMRKGDFTACELVKAHLVAIEEFNGALGAYLTIAEFRAIQVASRVQLNSPLAGIPFGVKDNIDTASIRTTSASRLLLENFPDRDSDVVALLDRAGAPLLGKLNTYEFGTGTGAVYPDLAFPIARNPWDQTRFSGGSSTGAGVAVAAGLAMFAIGTDTGGSVRLPAAACGVVGLKPTFGSISRIGMQPNCHSLDHVGVLARNISDVETVFNTVRSTPRNVLASGAKSNRLRVGFIGRFHHQDVVCDREITMALEAAAVAFRDLGAEVINLDLPFGVLDYRACSRILNVSECFSIHEQSFIEKRADMGAALRDKLLAGSQITASDYIRAVRWRGILARAVNDLFDHCDVLLCLGAPMVAPLLSDIEQVTAFTTQSAMAVFNVSGHPALSICSGFSKSGMPLNMQLAARYHSEDVLLSAGRLYEQATSHFFAPRIEKYGPANTLTFSAPHLESTARIQQKQANDAAVARMPRYLPPVVDLSSVFSLIP